MTKTSPADTKTLCLRQNLFFSTIIFAVNITLHITMTKTSPADSKTLCLYENLFFSTIKMQYCPQHITQNNDQNFTCWLQDTVPLRKPLLLHHQNAVLPTVHHTEQWPKHHLLTPRHCAFTKTSSSPPLNCSKYYITQNNDQNITCWHQDIVPLSKPLHH